MSGYYKRILPVASAGFSGTEIFVRITGTVYIIIPVGRVKLGFFRSVEFVILDNRITARYTVCHILECNGFIMPSEHTDEVYDAVDIRKTSYKNYRYNV